MEQLRIYDQLRQAIYNGKIRPGEKLSESRLVRQFKTSRGPLRESLLRLIGEGLIQREPRRACYVTELSVDDICDIYLLRIAVEPLAARMVTARTPKGLVKKLMLLARRIGTYWKRGKLIESAESDFEFHREIVLASGSKRLIRAYELAHVPMLMSRSPDSASDEMEDSHVAIVESICAGDMAQAELVARQHIEQAAPLDGPISVIDVIEGHVLSRRQRYSSPGWNSAPGADS